MPTRTGGDRESRVSFFVEGVGVLEQPGVVVEMTGHRKNRSCSHQGHIDPLTR